MRTFNSRRLRSPSGDFHHDLVLITSSGARTGCSWRPRRHQTMVPANNASPTTASPAAESQMIRSFVGSLKSLPRTKAEARLADRTVTRPFSHVECRVAPAALANVGHDAPS
jgi:hypothetical protein